MYKYKYIHIYRTYLWFAVLLSLPVSAAIWAWGCGACAPQKKSRRQTKQKTTKHNMPKEHKQNTPNKQTDKQTNNQTNNQTNTNKQPTSIHTGTITYIHSIHQYITSWYILVSSSKLAEQMQWTHCMSFTMMKRQKQVPPPVHSSCKWTLHLGGWSMHFSLQPFWFWVTGLCGWEVQKWTLISTMGLKMWQQLLKHIPGWPRSLGTY